jgi:hypothetical protein
MQQQIRYSVWAEFHTRHGIEFVDAEEMAKLPELGVLIDEDHSEFDSIVRGFGPYLESPIEDVESVEFNYGWGARMSAPGYMDCTDWSVFATEGEAQDYLDEYYG